MGHPCVPPPPCWLKKCALPLDFRAKTAQDARHFWGVLSAVMPTTASRVWLKKRTRHRNPPRHFWGAQARKSQRGAPPTSCHSCHCYHSCNVCLLKVVTGPPGQPQKVVIVVIVVNSWGSAQAKAKQSKTQKSPSEIFYNFAGWPAKL